jgi:NADH pyrophosphatase NudC (nudix superfamily)
VHKFVHFFLMRADGGDVSLHDHEYDDVRWVTANDARRMLSYATYREMLDRAIDAVRAAA